MESARVLLTGASGLLGSHVHARLEQLPWVRELLTPRSSEYDVRDQRAAQAMYADLRPDIVIHCASKVGGIKDTREHPAEFFYDNILIGTHALHEAWRAGVKKFIGIGTVCAYPEHIVLPFREADLWSGYPEHVNAPYGMAKKMLLVQGNAYREQYGFHAIHLLLVNLYGPGDNFDPESSHVIPGLIRKFIEARERGASSVTLWGDGSPTREFLHADDAARGIVLATENYDSPEPVNLGSGQEIAVRNLAVLIARETGFQGTIVWDTSLPNGQPKRCLDVSRAEKEFGFRATISLEQGIRESVQWFLQHR